MSIDKYDWEKLVSRNTIVECTNKYCQYEGPLINTNDLK